MGNEQIRLPIPSGFPDAVPAAGRLGKRFELTVDGEVTEELIEKIREAATTLLSNPVIEDVVAIKVQREGGCGCGGHGHGGHGHGHEGGGCGCGHKNAEAPEGAKDLLQ